MFIGLDAESLMHSICINCLKTGIMFRVDGKTEDASDKLAPVYDVDEIIRMIFANAMQSESLAELGSPIPDTVEEEIASIVDKKSDEMIAMLLSIDNSEQTELFACKCGRKECPKCRSDLFPGTSESEASELTNRKVEPALNSVEKTPVKTHVRVTNLNQLRPGDHIAWDRFYAIWHHAIVNRVETESQKIFVVHNSGGLKDKRNGKIASVREDTVKVDCTADFLYLYKYSDDECYPPEEVIERAVECLDQSYNPFTYNCEHFARWCKAGLKCCLQMEKFCQRLKMGASSLVKFIEEWTLVALRILGNSETMGQILTTGAKGARAAIKAELGRNEIIPLSGTWYNDWINCPVCSNRGDILHLQGVQGQEGSGQERKPMGRVSEGYCRANLRGSVWLGSRTCGWVWIFVDTMCGSCSESAGIFTRKLDCKICRSLSRRIDCSTVSHYDTGCFVMGNLVQSLYNSSEKNRLILLRIYCLCNRTFLPMNSFKYIVYTSDFT